VANNIVRLPMDYFPDPTKGRPVFNGSVYIGNPDTDPEVLGNRKTVTLRQEDGTEVPVTGAGQPLVTGSGGVILYNGSPVQALTDGNYSIKVLNSKGSQVYFVENALDGEPITIDSTIAVKNFLTLEGGPAETSATENTDVVDGDALNIKERTTGNGGGGMWDVVLSSTVTENTYEVVQCTGVGTLSLVARNTIRFNAKQAGAVTGSDAAPAVNSLLAALPSTGGTVFMPSGSYTFATEVWIKKNYNWIIFEEGSDVTIAPTADLVVFRVEAADEAGVIVGGGIVNPNFHSADTKFLKTCIKVIDASGFNIENPRTKFPHVLGAGSVGINFSGRELCAMRNIRMKADRPILLNKIPAGHSPSGISVDQHNFHNCYLISNTATDAVVEAEDGMLLTSISFTGFQSWIGGKDGFRWIDTTSAAVSSALSFKNVRWEQSPVSTGHIFDIQHNTELQGLSFENCKNGGENGYFLRKVSNVTFDNVAYTSATLVALDVDATVKEIEGRNCFWQAGSTANIVGQRLISATPKFPNSAPLSPSFHYTTSANAARAFVGDEVAESATLNGFTETPNAGAISATIRWTQIGNRVFGETKITATVDAEVASIGDSSFVSSTNLPTAAHEGVCNVVTGTVEPLGEGLVQANKLFTPTWSTRPGNFIIRFGYEIA